MESSTTKIGRLRQTARIPAVMLALAIGVGHDASAQELDVLEGDATVSTDPFMSGPAADASLLGDSTAPLDSYIAASGFPEEEVPTVRPVNWISGPYLRGGVNFVLNDEIFDVDQGTGYGISGGWRQPLGPEIGGDRFFFDLGGSYQEAIGESTPVLIEGLQATTTTTSSGSTSAFADVSDAFSTTLEELRRASVHFALGWFWGPGYDHRAADPQLRFATRLGGRVGHVRGGFDEKQLHVLPPDFISQAVQIRRSIDIVHYNQTDTYAGLFVGTEAILLQRQYSFGHFQWTVDGEYANDWINLGNVWDGSLGTASVMTGFMLSR